MIFTSLFKHDSRLFDPWGDINKPKKKKARGTKQERLYHSLCADRLDCWKSCYANVLLAFQLKQASEIIEDTSGKLVCWYKYRRVTI